MGGPSPKMPSIPRQPTAVLVQRTWLKVIKDKQRIGEINRRQKSAVPDAPVASNPASPPFLPVTQQVDDDDDDFLQFAGGRKI